MTDYEVLGLKDSATFDEIKKRFHQLVKMTHPDKYDNEDDRDLWNLANERMTQITEAYKRLSSKFVCANTTCRERDPEEAARGAKRSERRAGNYGESSARTETDAEQNDAERSQQAKSQTTNDLVRTQKVERIIHNLRNGLSSYEDIHDLIPNWFFHKFSNNAKEVARIASDDEIVNLIVEWVQRSVKDMGTYTFNSSAILTLERIESGLEFCLSDSSKRKIIAGIECVRKQIESKDLKYGRLEHFSSNSHPLKDQMKDRGLKIGLKGENEIVDNCKFCLHCCYRQKFLHKDWYCEIRKDDSKDSIDGNLRVIPSYNSCGNFERRRPSPMSLSKSKLMQYGIIQYAISQGYCYVDRSDIESFGVCKHCAHYIEQNRCQEEGCALRGRGDGYSSKRCCCKSFVPLFPDYYIKLRED